MIFKYGSYSHQQGEVTATLNRIPTYGPRGFRKGLREVVTLSGLLHADTSAELTAEFRRMDQAYSQDGQELAMYLPDGNTKTAVYLNPDEYLGGTRVTQRPSLPDLRGAQYVTFLAYTIQLEGFKPDAESKLLEFRETLTIRGTGGPRRVLIETSQGPVVEQIVRQRTTVSATQVGQATAFRSDPLIQPPVWPQFEDVDRRVLSASTPTSTRGVPDEFTVNWSYQFRSGGPLQGQPGFR